ncbi:hypothetical protein AY599_17675 [Leptolyngbya valderiana BDU 20041]|nr:hypothetical protein AY599_17675 [Leptolyngbya valderiana BDU 20041]
MLLGNVGEAIALDDSLTSRTGMMVIARERVFLRTRSISILQRQSRAIGKHREYRESSEYTVVFYFFRTQKLRVQY